MPKIDFKIQKSPKIDSNGFLSWAPQSAENDKNAKKNCTAKKLFWKSLKNLAKNEKLQLLLKISNTNIYFENY